METKPAWKQHFYMMKTLHLVKTISVQKFKDILAACQEIQVWRYMAYNKCIKNLDTNDHVHYSPLTLSQDCRALKMKYTDMRRKGSESFQRL